MKKPLVSVIIPVYNRLSLLKEAVSSVLAQTFRSFELIVADDCSDIDPESTILDLPGSEKTDIRIIRLGKHSGMPGFVRNRGVEASSAPYLAFLDSDDLWLPDKLEKQLRYLEKINADNKPGTLDTSRDTVNIQIDADNTGRAVILRNGCGTSNLPDKAGTGADTNAGKNGTTLMYGICHTRETWLRSGRTVSQSSQKHRREGDIFHDALRKCIIGPSTVMMERRLFEKYGGFREDLEVAEDYELWLKVTAANPVCYLDEPLTVKRAGGWEQLSEKYGQIEIFRINALKQLVEKGFFSSMPVREAEAVEELRNKCMIYAAGCRKRGREREAADYEALCGTF